YMLADTGARTIVSQSRFRDALAGFDGELVLLDDPGALSGEPSAPLPETSGASNLAYVIYTSGSTGDPKGVLVEHGNVMSSLRGLQERFPAGKDDGWLFKSNHTFDASLLEMFGPMWHGGRVVIVPAG